MKNMLSQFALNVKIGNQQGDIGYHPMITNDNVALTSILNLVYLWSGIIAVIVIIIAGIFFVSSRGDAAQIKRSKDAIRGAVIGLIVIMVAFAITRFVIGGVQG